MIRYNPKLSSRGFTLVEIVIVVAIGALILAGVLVAASDAAKSSRDAQRRNAISQTETALEQYAATHGGVYLCDATGTIVKIEQLYGGSDCVGGNSGAAPQYLDSGVNAPGTSSQYTSPSDPASPSLGEISITDRDGTQESGNSGYCIRIGLEAGIIYGATDDNKSGRTNPC